MFIYTAVQHHFEIIIDYRASWLASAPCKPATQPGVSELRILVLVHSYVLVYLVYDRYCQPDAAVVLVAAYHRLRTAVG